MDASPSPVQMPNPAPQILEQSSSSPTAQAIQEVRKTFPYKSALVLIVAIFPIIYGVNVVARTVQNLDREAAKRQALIDNLGDEDLTTQETTTVTYENPLDESTQYENPFTVSAYSNPFDE